MKTPQKIINDMISKNQWIQCPKCHGINSEKCEYCKTWGTIKIEPKKK